MVNILDDSIISETQTEMRKLKGKDKFEMMIEMQLEAAARYGLKLPVDLNTKKGQKLLKDLVFCMVEELFEMTNTLKNREWTKTEVQLDKEHFLDELSDVMLFFFEFLGATGIPPEKLLELFLKKFKVNEFRNKTNY